MSASPRVLITCVQLQRTIDEHLDALTGLELITPTIEGQQLSEAEMLDLVPGVDGIIAGDDEITPAVLARADRLRVVSKWGVGVDNINVGAAVARGIRVANTPGVFGDEVADVVIGYLVLLARKLHAIDRAVRAGGWPKPEGTSLAGRTIGIIGLGDIGYEVARRSLAMRMRVLGTDIRGEAAGRAAEAGVEVVDPPLLIREADVVSLNCPLTESTRHLIDETALMAMKPGAWLINTSRGGLVDEPALVDALQRGQIGAAALDVFEEEPLPATSPLRSLDNVLLGSHNSSNTAEAVRRTSDRAIRNLLAGLQEPAS